jgi:hypothetical protein
MGRITENLMRGAVIVVLTAAGGAAANAQLPLRLLNTPCSVTPPVHCPDTGCPGEIITNPGNATEPESGRQFFLDYPCDLLPDDPVNLILSLHGAGAPANWHRHYFPAMDYKDSHGLVIITPTQTDAAYLQTLVEMVVREIGAQNIASFWLAGHSAGGMASNRIVCTDYFAERVDGWLSLSGGYVGEAGRTDPGDCDFSHIYTVGEVEVTLAAAGGGRGGAVRLTPEQQNAPGVERSAAEILPVSTSWSEKYGCGTRVRLDDIVDEKAGYVYDSATDTTPNPRRGGRPAPGTAQVYDFPNCNDGRVVATVIRMEKAHAEGLEPKVTEALLEMMLSAKGGKFQQLGSQ